MYHNMNLSLFSIVALCLCVVVFSKTVEDRQQYYSRIKRTTATSSSSSSTTVDINNSCDNVKSFFELRNITVIDSTTINGPKGNICGGHCCGPDVEATLRKQGQRDFASLLRHNSRSLQGLLNSTAAKIQNHVVDLTRQYENRTLSLFSRVYSDRSAVSTEAIHALYADIRSYVQTNETSTSGGDDAADDATSSFPSASVDIKETVTRFYADIFPLAYRHTANLSEYFTAEYKTCLKRNVHEIQPFNDIPRQITQVLTKGLDAVRLLLKALDIGIEVLNATDRLIVVDDGKMNAECHDALMKMTYCPKCLGFKGRTRPCTGLCLNVLRGCLTRYVSELESPWNSYVDGIEHLVTAMRQTNNDAGVNIDAVVRNLDMRISESILYIMEKKSEIINKVKRTCGVHKLTEKEDPSSLMQTDASALNDGAATATTTSSSSAATPSNNGKSRASVSVNVAPPPQLDTQHFLYSIGKSKSFYHNLADNLCKDESFADTKDAHCWNGERIGEYMKTVVEAGFDMQKYNPEVKPSTNLQNVDSGVANLADKLRHVHQMVMSSLGSVTLPESDSFMQGDGADGSGSGSGVDSSEDDDDTRGSGSGDGPATGVEITGDKGTNRNHMGTGQDPEVFTPSQATTPISSRSLLMALSVYYLLTIIDRRVVVA